MKIFDHVDYGDKNHDIKNYRGKSAYRSAIRIDGNSPHYDASPLKPLEEKPIATPKTPKQQEQLDKLGHGNITFTEISADDGKWTDGIDDPLSFGKNTNFLIISVNFEVEVGASLLGYTYNKQSLVAKTYLNETRAR
jgi:hypothetical protein